MCVEFRGEPLEAWEILDHAMLSVVEAPAGLESLGRADYLKRDFA